MNPTSTSVPKCCRLRRALLCVAGVLFASTLHAGKFSLSTEFVYRGQLQHLGRPAEGIFDISFELYDQAWDGRLLGTIDRFDIGIERGTFAVSLDFGTEAVGDLPRWLEVRVRAAGEGAYESLLPRHSVMPTGASTCVVDSDVEVHGRLALTTSGGGTPPDVDEGGQLAILGQLGGVKFDENEIQTFSIFGSPRDLILNADGGRVGIGVEEPEATLHINTDSGLGIVLESESLGTIFNPGGIHSTAGPLILGPDVIVNTDLLVGRDLTVGRNLVVLGAIDIGYESLSIDSPGNESLAYCTEGKRVVSGGCSNSDSAVQLKESRPLYQPDGWACAYDNDNFVTTVSLICADVE